MSSPPIGVRVVKRIRKDFKRAGLVQSGKKKVLLEAINHPKFQNRKFRTGSPLLWVPHALLVVKCQRTQMLKVKKKCVNSLIILFFPCKVVLRVAFV